MHLRFTSEKQHANFLVVGLTHVKRPSHFSEAHLTDVRWWCGFLEVDLTRV